MLKKTFIKTSDGSIQQEVWNLLRSYSDSTTSAAACPTNKEMAEILNVERDQIRNALVKLTADGRISRGRKRNPITRKPMRQFFFRDGATTRWGVIDSESDDEEPEFKQDKPCLTCGDVFESFSPYIRMCDLCKRRGYAMW